MNLMLKCVKATEQILRAILEEFYFSHMVDSNKGVIYWYDGLKSHCEDIVNSNTVSESHKIPYRKYIFRVEENQGIRHICSAEMYGEQCKLYMDITLLNALIAHDDAFKNVWCGNRIEFKKKVQELVQATRNEADHSTTDLQDNSPRIYLENVVTACVYIKAFVKYLKRTQRWNSNDLIWNSISIDRQNVIENCYQGARSYLVELFREYYGDPLKVQTMILEQEANLRYSEASLMYITPDDAIKKTELFMKTKESAEQIFEVANTMICNESYLSKWNAPLFLENSFSPSAKTMKEMFQFPGYVSSDEIKTGYSKFLVGSDHTKEIVTSDLTTLYDLEYFLKKKISYTDHYDRMCVILGKPGIGKSTLVSWMISEFTKQNRDVICLRFADMKEIDWDENLDSVFSLLYAYIGCKNRLDEINWDDYEHLDELLNAFYASGAKLHEELEGKTIILEGFDETNAKAENRLKILNRLYDEIADDDTLKNVQIFVTCRENYIDFYSDIQLFRWIELQPFAPGQVIQFIKKYRNISDDQMMEEKHFLRNYNEVMGIPLILYMMEALQISSDNCFSEADIYDRIFAINGGIYDKCIHSEQFHSKLSYDKGSKGLSEEAKSRLDRLSRDISFWIFEHDQSSAVLPVSVLGDSIRSMEELDLFAGFFNIHHTEGLQSSGISFIHRSIYEYFVADTICKRLIRLFEKNDMVTASLIGHVLFPELYFGSLTPVMLRYLVSKFIGLGRLKDTNFFEISFWRDIAAELLEHGLLVYHEFDLENVFNTEESISIRQEKMYELPEYCHRQIVGLHNLMDLIGCIMDARRVLAGGRASIGTSVFETITASMYEMSINLADNLAQNEKLVNSAKRYITLERQFESKNQFPDSSNHYYSSILEHLVKDKKEENKDDRKGPSGTSAKLGHEMREQLDSKSVSSIGKKTDSIKDEKNNAKSSGMPYQFDKVAMGLRLKELREKRGISISELMDILADVGCKSSVQSIWNWEHGKRTLTMEMLFVLACIYDVEIKDLLITNDEESD